MEEAGHREPFAAVITVEDPEGELPIYSAARSEAPNRYRTVLEVQANLGA